MKILVVNAGSSSMKFMLFAMENEEVLAKGVYERLGTDRPNLIYKRPDGFKFEKEIFVEDHAGALREICAKLVDPEMGVIKSLSEIAAVGHRVLHGGEKITAPMPGTILDVKVANGQAVKKGDILMILEAMKMENEILAPCDGTVNGVSVAKGATVETGAVLCAIQ